MSDRSDFTRLQGKASGVDPLGPFARFKVALHLMERLVGRVQAHSKVFLDWSAWTNLSGRDGDDLNHGHNAL